MRTGRVGRRGLRVAGALAHLLLVVALALGVFVMHAVGHPEGSSGSGADHAISASGAGADHATSASAPAHHGGADASDPSEESGAHGDMATLCVAVLGVWALARVVLAVLDRRPDWLVRLLGRLVAALGPNAPPPRPPDLAQLSVLRI
ncbi:DUF6153 family protein [Streptomyces sp. NPDC047981]|uniref:DUF6153 family protein n=1 Tax=Streptomyces sp. NPDC047981 TaxID=3154610 RepID=UPI003422EA6D